MQFLIDNALATIVAGTVLLILVFVNHDDKMATVDSINYYAFKQQELAFIEVLQRDLQGVSKVISVAESPIDSSFTFNAQLSPNNPAQVPIVYRRTRVGHRDSSDLYQIIRYQDGKESGRSMVTMTEWTIVAQTHQGTSITNPDDAKQIFVSFEAAAPFKEAETIERSRWQATFRPPLLQNSVLL